jgi:hypothetical protein
LALEAEDAAKMPAFFRATARVELRCSRGTGGLTPDAPLKEAIAAWAQQAGLALPMGQDGWSPWLAAADRPGRVARPQPNSPRA